jgi:para-nitrobenzyl esterase
VLFWIHEGGFQWGEGTRDAVNGEALSQKGAVVVTINYRLNVFGFFAHPELSRESTRGVSGNYGLLDMIAAIKWTRRNIRWFGGDPKRITIFGESAGSSAVSGLAASPLVAGDIKGAIAESTLMIGLPTLSEEEDNGVKFAAFAKAKSVQELREMPADRLLSAFALFKSKIDMAPVIDGWVLPSDALSAETRSLAQPIPILTGSNADEGTDGINPVSAKLYIEQSRRLYGDRAGRFLALYPAGSEAEAASSQFAVNRDQQIWAHTRWAELHARNGHPSYLYFFTHAPPPPPAALYNYEGGLLPARLGAFHTGEICYVFESLNRVKRPWTLYDHKLAEIISSYWVNFAAHGDPNGKGLPFWPVFGDKPRPVMELGDLVRPIPLVLSGAKADFWQDDFVRTGGR